MKKLYTRDTADISQRKLLIVTGHQTLRTSIGDLINLQSDLTVGDQVADLVEARHVLNGNHMDLAIVDRLVCESIGNLRQALFPVKPEIPIVLMSMDNSLAQTKAALAAGVRGIVAKQDVAEEIVSAVREVLDGRWYVSHELLNGISDEVKAQILAGDVTGWNE